MGAGSGNPRQRRGGDAAGRHRVLKQPGSPVFCLSPLQIHQAEPAPAELPEGKHTPPLWGNKKRRLLPQGRLGGSGEGRKGLPRGWVCCLPTETTRLVGVADADGKRIGQFSPKKVRLLVRSTGFSWKEVCPHSSPE